MENKPKPQGRYLVRIKSSGDMELVYISGDSFTFGNGDRSKYPLQAVEIIRKG
jgi:hypothetical protein